MAVLTKFSEAMSSSPSACRRTSLAIAAAISASASASDRYIDESDEAGVGINRHFTMPLPPLRQCVEVVGLMGDALNATFTRISSRTPTPR